MRTHKGRFFGVLALLFLATITYAQCSAGSNYLLYGLIGVGLIVLIFAILTITDNLLQIEGKKSGLKSEKTGLFSGLLGGAKKRPSFVPDGATFKHFSKGYDLKLAGAPSDEVVEKAATRYALKPTDFIGMSPIPKVVPQVGDDVKAGDPIFFDKKRPEIMYCAPVSGEIVDVVRGAKRAITDVVILADKGVDYKIFNPPSLDADRRVIVDFLAASGTWPMINQRPFDVVPNTTDEPRDIFISTFDTAPLAPKTALIMEGNEAHFQKGLDVLNKLTTGSVYIGVEATGNPISALTEAKGVEINYFSGKHPAGNVGIQIHNTKPIKGEDKVWTLDLQAVITIGRLFNEGKFDPVRIISFGGPQAMTPVNFKVRQGANIGELIADNIREDNNRIIVGDIFTGREAEKDGFLSFRSDQITVLKEGDHYEAFGWLLPLAPRPSVSGTFPNFLYPDFEFEADTNTHGERRAFVVTGQYEAVLPMDIYPQHLMKAIMAGDFERMEGLGINELSEEDIALCEFVCTSKMPLQSILREGLEMMREQG